MKLIDKNPFRITGLISNCKERDFQQQHAKFNALLNINKDIKTEFDFPLFSRISRDESLINDSFASIENINQRLLYSLFWFVSFGNSDELAFENLRTGDIEKALDIWSMIHNSSLVTPRKLSAINNLSTLFLELAFLDEEIDLDLFIQAILLKRELIESDFFADFSYRITNNKNEIHSTEISTQFLDLLLSDSDALRIGKSDLIDLYLDAPKDIYNHLGTLLAAESQFVINNTITETENNRKEFPEKSASFGEKLFRKINKELAVLKEIYGLNSVEYEMSADKAALEVLRCGLDYFECYRDSDELDPSWRTMRLFRRAKFVSVLDSSTARIVKNIFQLQEWINDKAEQDRFSGVAEEFEQLKNYLDNFQNKSATYQNASELILNCRPLLLSIKEKLSKNDELYLVVSSAVVRNSQGMMAEILNSAHEKILETIKTGNTYGVSLVTVKTALSNANRLSNLLAVFDMNDETRTQYQENNVALQTLNKMYSEIKSETPGTSARAVKRQNISFSSSSEIPNTFSTITTALSESPGVPAGIILFLVLVSCLGINLFSNIQNSGISKSTSNISNTFDNRSNFNSNVNNNSLPSNVKITRPKNGETLFAASKSKGYGSLSIENGTDNDAIAKLVNLNTGKTYKQVYIQSRSNHTISGIKSGSYSLKFGMGKNYSPVTGKFLTDESFEEFDETLDYTVTRNGYGVQWKEYRASLGRVVGGNATTSSINANDFADK